ncbi:hypothetical protein LTR10_004502 [Elasticomyces elasticus]|nr:hypothetical protein LTR10_004502 [Elasticomyces elasticus]KAK4976821.1 hypothetical protein LTR42_002866 [Elasticomyces elasticus]
MATTRSGEEHDDYWKLTVLPQSAKGMRLWLEERKYHVGSIKSTARLQECVRRAQLGLMSYHKLTNDELRGLITARRIDASGYMTRHNRGTREELLRSLDYEDMHPLFLRFLNLPPELRNRVYGYYYAEFRQPIYAPSQPPLSRVCRQLREESLPMFYSTCEFDFRLQRFQRGYDGRTPPTGPCRVTICDRMLLFLHSTLARYLACIRTIWIGLDDVQIRSDSRGNGWRLYRIQIRNNGECVVRAGAKVNAVVLTSSTHRPWNITRLLILAALLKVSNTITARSGMDKLRKEDFFEIRRVVEYAKV